MLPMVRNPFIHMVAICRRSASVPMAMTSGSFFEQADYMTGDQEAARAHHNQYAGGNFTQNQ